MSEWATVLPQAPYTPICPRHPGVNRYCYRLWEVIKRLVANQLHESFTPAGYSASRAFATEVSMSPASVIATLRGQLGFTHISFIARSLPEGIGAPMRSACSLITKSTQVMCLMNGYSTFSKLTGNLPFYLATDIFS